MLPLLAFALVTLAIGSAGATSIPNAIYTLDNPVAFSIIGASGTVDAYDPLVEGPLTPATILCLDGSCSDPNDFSNQDWMVFRVSVSSGALDQVTIGALFEGANAVAYFTGLGGQAPSSGDATTNPNSPEWLFAGASLTTQSVPLIAIYDAGDLPSAGGGPFGVGATNFDLRLGGASDQFLGAVNTLIPEPGTALLLGLGLVVLGTSRPRARR
jgi:hypothetical protein